MSKGVRSANSSVGGNGRGVDRIEGRIGDGVGIMKLNHLSENETLILRTHEVESEWEVIGGVGDMQSSGTDDQSVAHSHDQGYFARAQVICLERRVESIAKSWEDEVRSD